MSGVFVRPSIRLSHADIESKLLIVGSCGLHRLIAQGLLVFLDQICTSQENTLTRALNVTVMYKNEENADFFTNKSLYLGNGRR